jgi:hypothetical protein
VFFEKPVATLADAIEEVKFAVSIEKAAEIQPISSDRRPPSGPP